MDAINFFPPQNRVSLREKAYDMLPRLGAVFPSKKEDFCKLSAKYNEIKAYNPKCSDISTIMHLDEDSYKTMLDVIRNRPERQKALMDKRSELSCEFEHDSFDGITDKKLQLAFSNGFGSYSKADTSNEFGDLIVQRETSLSGRSESTSFVDRSHFNPDYEIENSYKEAMDAKGGFTTTQIRDISIKDSNDDYLLRYSYSRQGSLRGDNVKYSVNGKKYEICVNKNGKVNASSKGCKDAVLDFAPRIKDYSEAQKETFMNALKLLPPQILLSFDDEFDSIPKENGLFINLLCPEVTAGAIINSTVQYLSNKKSLTDNEELHAVFEEEKENFKKWLDTESEGRLKMGAEYYTKNLPSETDEIKAVIKAVCSLLWLENYDENYANDEGKRILLNLFPKTTSFIISYFELNQAS